jgi:hypothetical protein
MPEALAETGAGGLKRSSTDRDVVTPLDLA